MNKRDTIIISALLSICLVYTASCGAADGSADATSAESSETATETFVTELGDCVPKLDFGGAEFRTIEQSATVYGFYSAEANGDVVNDAIYERNRSMEERFNITFTETQREAYTDISTIINKAVMSGSDEYELVFGQMFQSATDSQSGIFRDWNEIKYVDFTKPWYVKSISDSSVGGKLYMIESELSIGYFQQTWMILYNKSRAADDSGFPDLYAMVDEGKWTLDELNRLTAELYEDVNGDSVRDDTDFYGFAGTPGGCLLAGFIYGSDAKLADVGDDLKIVHSIAGERTVGVLKKLSKLFCSNSGTIVKTSALSSVRKTLFPKGIVMFEAMQMNDLLREDFDMRSMTDEFGVLPLPKYDESQSEYYTVVDGGADIITVLATAQKLDMIGAITEAMSAASYFDVIPAYIGTAIEQKGVRDEESIRIMRKILDSRVMDFAYLYNGSSGGWVMKLNDLIKNEDSIVSSIEANKVLVGSYYQGIIDYMTGK